MPVSETLARSTWFRNSSRNSTSPQLAHDVGTQQGTLCLAPACASLALSCAAPLQPSSLHFHLTSPHVRPPPCLCCPVFEDHLALAHRPPPAINALPSHPYPAATVRYARPRLKHHPQSQERHVCSCLCPCACVSVCAWASSVPRSRDHCMASHGIASRPIASQPHPIAAHQLQLQPSMRACVISCLLCCVASPGPNSTCSRIAATCPLELPLPLTCGLLLSNLLQVCYRAEVFDSAQPFCASGTPNSIGGSSAERQRLCPIRCVSGMWARSLVQASKPALPVLCTAQMPIHSRRQKVSSLSSTSGCFVQNSWTKRLSYGQPWRQIHLGGCYPLAPTTEISPMGGNGVSPSRQIDSLPRACLGSSCPGSGSMQKARH